MRIPVFARGSNPSVDPPILRKSLVYCERQVRDLLAAWLDPEDHSKGIIAREYLPRETAPVLIPEPPDPALPSAELPGITFEDPETSQKTRDERARLVEAARMVCYFGPDKDLVKASA